MEGLSSSGHHFFFLQVTLSTISYLKMKGSCIATIFLTLIVLATAATIKDFKDAGYKVIKGRKNLRLANITIAKAKSSDLPFDEETPIGKIFSSGPRVAGRSIDTTARNNLACPGPGPGFGIALSPLTLSFSPPGVAACLTLVVGPPFPCLCSYRCRNVFFPFKFCSFTCGGVTIKISGFNGFSCNIKGRKLVGLPGLGICPLPDPANLCRV